jgi:hypothetical protein
MPTTDQQPRLTIELVPQGQWGINLRSELSSGEWNRLRRSIYAAADYKCEICTGIGPKHPVECHERWDYNEETKTQTLVGLIALCPACHEVKHFGRAQAVGKGDAAMTHLMGINGWSGEDAMLYLEGVFEVWHKRSAEDWTLDISWMQHRGVGPNAPTDGLEDL